MNTSIFENLFVFEMANNHQGSVAHGLKIIQEMAEIARKFKLKATVKLQYRQLDTFIHPDYRDRSDVQHIPRFISTALSRDDFHQLVQATKAAGMLSMVTPFDEDSVDVCLEHDVDILKVASCSATDWPLLEKIAAAKRPVIFSTGGVSISEVDKLVSFFAHQNIAFAIMHCVALYPTPNAKLQMGIIRRLANRYPGIPIGYSGHESPDNHDPVKIAVAMGARMFERHVGVPTDKIKLNTYSMAPGETEAWVHAAFIAKSIVGDPTCKELPDEERASLLSLQRGVYARIPIKKGERISPEAIFFAMPCQPEQTTSGQFGSYRTTYVASKDYNPNEAIYEAARPDIIKEIRNYIHDAKGMLYEARIQLGTEFTVELSHHSGIEKFGQVGCLIVNVINREYCKKLIVVLPGQHHPNHRHQKKEETFQVLHGEVEVTLNGGNYVLQPGNKLLIERGSWHSFHSPMGAIFEEISTTHIVGDSYYEDPAIAGLDPMQRKTVLETW